MDAPKCIWTGEAADDHWQLMLTSIYEGPLAYPVADEADEEFVEGSHALIWKLVFVSQSGERLDAQWDPHHRLLHAQLRGWSKPAIGALKRHLIRLGERP